MDLTHYQGQILIATFISTALWGMQCIQTLFYFETYQSDKWYLKAIVAALCVLNSVHEILCIKTSWSMIIPRFGGLTSAGNAILPREFFFQVTITGVVATLTHVFFLWRIWRFTASKVFLVVIIPPTIGQLVCAFLYTAKAMGKTQNFLSSPLMRSLALAMILMETPVDMFTAVAMCIVLWKSRTGLPTTNRMVLRLINLSVSTGACLAFCGIGGFVTLLRWPDEMFYWLGGITVCSMYCNVVIASLNSRKYLTNTDMMVDPFAGGAFTGLSFSLSSSAARRSIPLNPITGGQGEGDTSSEHTGEQEDMPWKTVHIDCHSSDISQLVQIGHAS